jgi:hypothetical protein
MEGSDNRYLREMAEREIRKIDLALATGRAELARKRLSTPTVTLQSVP